MIVFQATTAQDMKEEILKYLDICIAREHGAVSVDKTQRDQQARRARIRVLESIVFDIQHSDLRKEKETE